MKGRADPPLDVRLLGRFEIRVDGRAVTLPSRPAQSLFAYLVLTAGTAHRREKLAALLWPDADEENGRSYLRHALWRIRKAVATDSPNGGYIQSDDIAVRFDGAASYRLDVAEFEKADSGPTETLAASLEGYRGELLPGFYDEWAILERERLEALLPIRMQRLIDGLSAEAKWPQVIEWAERWISLGHAPEGAYRALMRAHHEQGDRARMIAAYQRCAAALKRELDVEPSDETRELFERLAQGQRSATPAAVTAAPIAAAAVTPTEPAPPDHAVPPFKGLQHFDEADAGLFFGREELTARLARRLEEVSFLAVIGASGSGKSSLLRAGLVPTLKRQSAREHPRQMPGGASRDVRLITPGAHPLEALAVALTSGARSTAVTAALLDALGRDARSLRLHVLAEGHPIVLVVDQFEELFTLCADRAEREEFVDNLLAASLPERDQPVQVVLAMRADFYAHCAEYPGLRDALARYQEYIGPMGPEDLRRAIEAPAQQQGYSFEPGLVEHLLHEVGDEPGALPLLAHVLLETWHRRQRRALTLSGYAASGGVRGAIARTAEAFYERADEAQRRIARRIFLRLTELGEGTEDTRRRVGIDELTSSAQDPAAVLTVLRTLADARLVTLGERMAEVSHEAVIREWPRLREWLDQDRELIRAQRQLTRAAIEWDRLDRDAGALYRGSRLDQALAWLGDSAEGDLTDLERSFLETSRENVEREAREREETRERELRAAERLAASERTSAERLRRRAIFLAATLIVLVLTAGMSAFFAERARSSAALAELEQQRTLLESARVAADHIDSRLSALSTAIAPPDLHHSLSLCLARRDHPNFLEPCEDGGDITAVLGALRLSAGPEVNLLFMTNYLTGEVLAVDEITSRIWKCHFGPCIPKTLADPSVEVIRALRALEGTAPRMPPECKREQSATPYAEGLLDEYAFDWEQYFQSLPYQPISGFYPSVAMVHYGPPCDVPYALIVDVSLRYTGEWMGRALASTDDAYLVDANGRLLGRTRVTPDHLRDISASTLVARALASTEPFVIEADDPLGAGPAIAAVAPVGDRGWRVIVVRRALGSN